MSNDHFPGRCIHPILSTGKLSKVKRVKNHNGRWCIHLTPSQRAWLESHYPVMLMKDIVRETTLSKYAISDMARKYGWHRDYKVIGRLFGDVLRRSYREGRITRKLEFSDAAVRGMKTYLEKRRRGEVKSPIDIFKERHPERAAEVFAQHSRRLRETVAKEKRRIIYGLQQKTHYHIVMKPFTPSQHSKRSYALKRGYIIYEDCSEQGGERYNIYYDADTDRSERFEAGCIKAGFKIKPFEETESDEQQESEL